MLWRPKRIVIIGGAAVGIVLTGVAVSSEAATSGGSAWRPNASGPTSDAPVPTSVPKNIVSGLVTAGITVVPAATETPTVSSQQAAETAASEGFGNTQDTKVYLVRFTDDQYGRMDEAGINTLPFNVDVLAWMVSTPADVPIMSGRYPAGEGGKQFTYPARNNIFIDATSGAFLEGATTQGYN